MVELAERMPKLHKNLPKAKTAPDKTAIERQIAATDQESFIGGSFTAQDRNEKRISRANEFSVYELYGLTQDEIEIVEGEEK